MAKPRIRLEPTSVDGLPVYADAYQVAAILGVTLKTVYETAEQLGAIRVGKNWRFPVNALPGQPGHKPKGDE